MPDGTYVELVRSLFDTLLPTTIMACSFLAVGAFISSDTGDTPLAILTLIGGAAAFARISVILVHRKRAADDALCVTDAQTFERRFALAYLGFALVLGLFGARAFLVAQPETHLLIVGLLFGYGAGVAAGLSLRPWISVPSIVIVIVPAIVTTLIAPDVAHRATGVLFAVFLAGGIQSMLLRYRSEAKKVTMRRQFSTLARCDDLTGLPNRLSLREQYEALAGLPKDGGGVAVHCLDLDRFKPVNDLYGHPAGDALLKAVSGRLDGLLRRGDFAARLGGDEFAVVQASVGHADEAEMLARRVARAVAQPYEVEGHQIIIGTSIGYVLSAEQGDDLEHLLACADDALCQIKRNGGGVAGYRQTAPTTELRKIA